MALNAVRRAALAGLVYLGSVASATALARQDYIGSIGLVGTKNCPSETREAQGQLLKIAEFNFLFALIGTTFGGDGKTTFALPNLTTEVPLTGTRYCIVVLGTYPPKP